MRIEVTLTERQVQRVLEGKAINLDPVQAAPVVNATVPEVPELPEATPALPPQIHDFRDIFGVDFGDKVQGSGLELKLSRLNPNLKGRAIRIAVSQQPWGEMPISSAWVALDGFAVKRAGDELERLLEIFPKQEGAQQTITNKVKGRVTRAGADAFFPFFSPFAMQHQPEAYPVANRPLVPGQWFFVTFEDDHGEKGCLRCTFKVPDSDSQAAGFARKNSTAEVVYHCRY